MTGGRHYGMDWLRIGAFALLIFYHIGMYFVPWDWHVKIVPTIDWVALPMLAEAVFPFYIIHQTIIVVVGLYLSQADVPALPSFLILVAATVAGCWLFYWIGRNIGWLRPLIGLQRK
jgi:membrane protein DedA with SNARE-associated domain